MTNPTYIRNFPSVIRIEPAGACNLACSHCPTGTITMARGIMRSELFNRIVESIKPHLDLVRVVVLYHGGEPLLNRHFGQMVRELKSLNIPFVKTVSNGMLLSDQACADIVNYRLDAIEFSLDGESAEENNFIRRNAQFEHIKTNIFKLIEYKQRIQSALPRIAISTTQFVRPDNYTRDQQAAAPDYLLQAFGEQDVAFKPTFAMRWPHMIVMDDIYDQFNDPFDQDDKNSCDHVDSTITIRWNGDVVPCCYDLTSQLVMGNVLEKDIADIWNNQAYLNLRRSISERTFVTPCNNCNVVRPNVYLTLKPKPIQENGEQP